VARLCKAGELGNWIRKQALEEVGVARKTLSRADYPPLSKLLFLSSIGLVFAGLRLSFLFERLHEHLANPALHKAERGFSMTG
jgi:hypothetical protein